MKVLILFWLCFPLAISGKGGKGFKVKEVADLAFEVISLSIDFIDQLTSGDDSNTIQKSIENLQSSVDKLHEKLDYTTQLVESLISLINEQPYKISISQHIEQIKSCKTDLENVLETPNSIAARENFRKCYVIMNNVRAIGGYLSGQAIIGLHPFFESYRHKDGYYNGYAIKTMFQYLYTHFIDGCTVVVTAERIQFNQTSTIYRDECWKTVSEIYRYMREFYRKCIKASCPWFISQVGKFLDRPEVVDVYSANNVLQNNFPWFQFLILESLNSDSVVENVGFFPVNSNTFLVQKTYRVFWTDSFVLFANNNKTRYQQAVNVTISICDYGGSSYGMNLTRELYLKEKLFSFVGLTSNETMDTCKYPQESYTTPSLASSPQKLPLASMFTLLALAFNYFFLK